MNFRDTALAGLLFIRSLKKNLLGPLEEIRSVLRARKQKDLMRRCTGFDLPLDIKKIYNDLNELLDHSGIHPMSRR